MNFNLRSRMLAEFLGTAFLLAAVVGSGIMGEQLASGNVAIALLANTLATGTMLTVLILTLGPISGAHFNPAVTLALAANGKLSWRDVPSYLGAQFGGAFAGVASAHLMFGMPLFFASTHARRGLHARPAWRLPTVERSRRHLRAAVRDLGMFALPACGDRVCSGRLHYFCLLVYRFDLFRKSGGHDRPFC
jgi:glycerol uptake facilitator-like aquaporin